MVALHRRIYYARMIHGRGVCRLGSPIILAAAITGSGDIVSQLVVEGCVDLDRYRLLVHTCVGGVADGAVLQHWYKWLHWHLPSSMLSRLLLHQLAFAPLMIATFVGAVSLSEARVELWQKVRQEWPAAVYAHWLLVGSAQVLNMRCVPRHYQILCANSCALVWAVGLSWLSHRPMQPPCLVSHHLDAHPEHT